VLPTPLYRRDPPASRKSGSAPYNGGFPDPAIDCSDKDDVGRGGIGDDGIYCAGNRVGPGHPLGAGTIENRPGTLLGLELHFET
jgi:hypothetical protein